MKRMMKLLLALAMVLALPALGGVALAASDAPATVSVPYVDAKGSAQGPVGLPAGGRGHDRRLVCLPRRDF